MAVARLDCIFPENVTTLMYTHSDAKLLTFSLERLIGK
jgi:hypothetical protein